MATRGRYAPTPSGLIHVGNARTALVAWLAVRSAGGTFVWRLEDLDPPRTVPGAAEAAIDDLRWLGLDWDEGPDVGGPYGPYVQSERSDRYDDALRRLAQDGRLFPCRHSRKDLKALAVAPHGGGHGPRVSPYPAHLRPDPGTLSKGWIEDHLGPCGADDASLRFRVDGEPVRVEDRFLGQQTERVDQAVGDFVLRRRDGLYAYQLAVVVDDLAMEIDDVVRGVDLMESTARQVQLIRALGGTVPNYGHVPLVLNAEGEKLSKRDGGLTLRSLRERGVAPEALVGYLAFSLGLRGRPTPAKPRDLLADFRWDRLRREDWTLPADLASALVEGSPLAGYPALT